MRALVATFVQAGVVVALMLTAVADVWTQRGAPIGVPRAAIGDGPWVLDTAEQHKIKVSVVAGGLANPWSMAWLPNGDILITERPGRLRVLHKDGVLDPQDRCPGTPPGVAVDAVGCPRKDAVTLKGVGFEYNSATLTSDSRPVLDDAAADLKKYPRLKVELQGHTDSRGSDQYNLKLSQRRAEAVRDYLLNQGVPSNQLSAKGYGETRPKASNDDDAGRAENRRVDMQVLENPGAVDVKTEGATPE